MKSPQHRLSVLCSCLLLVLVACPSAWAFEVTPTKDAGKLAAQLFTAAGIQVTSKSYIGADTAAGTFTKGPLGLPDGVILSSGNAKAAEPPNSAEDTTTEHKTAGDALCNKLVPGFDSFDAARLEVKFKTDTKTTGIRFEYVVGTEE